MKRIYFDNAATTAIDPAVFEKMKPYFLEKFGNPSSIHSYGRETRLAIEKARKTVAATIHAHTSEIVFTSCGTESTNTAINAAVHDLGCKHIITSPIEHHATLHTVQHLATTGEVKLSFVNLKENAVIDYDDLERLLKESNEKCLVTLMHGNNEIGNITDIKKAGELCRQYDAVFHSDTVQTLGHFPIDVSQIPVDFINGTAHKFHGPKGVGMLYVRRGIKIHPFIEGGAQERDMRGGTENIYGIVGFAEALQLAVDRMEEDRNYIRDLKNYMMERLKKDIPTAFFNGDFCNKNLYTVLSVGFPKSEKAEMLLFNLDIHNICVSGGSACSAGSPEGSHVIAAIPNVKEQVPVRFSFSKYNTKEEVDQVIETLRTLI